MRKKRVIAFVLGMLMFLTNTVTAAAFPMTNSIQVQTEQQTDFEQEIIEELFDDVEFEIKEIVSEEITSSVEETTQEDILESEETLQEEVSESEDTTQDEVLESEGTTQDEGLENEGTIEDKNTDLKKEDLQQGVKTTEESKFLYCVLDDGTIEITGHTYEGEMPNEDFVIPSEIDGYKVSSIGEEAFKDFRLTGGLVKLVISEGIAHIGEGAFRGSYNFTGDLIIPDSVIDIGDYAFYDCGTLDGKLVLSDSLTSIGMETFRKTDFTGDLIIPDGVIEIGERAFLRPVGGGTGFGGNLVIPDSVARIGEQAFWGCNFTGNLVISSSVEHIGKEAFGYAYQGYPTLTIEEGVSEIGDFAFASCGLSGNLVIPDSVTHIGEGAFKQCYSNGYIDSTLTIGKGVTEIGASAFSSCYGFTGELNIPEGVTSIGNSAFSGCSGFTGELDIPAGVTSIGNSVFSGCSGFTGELDIPAGVTSIGNSAFNGCSGFTGELDIPVGVTSIGSSAFSRCSGFTGELDIPVGVTSIGNSAFSGCSGFSVLDIPEGVTSIGNSAFSGCSGFSGELDIPTSITSIGSAAFENCSGFTGTLDIPAGVTEIGNYAFSGCSGFTGNLVIPTGVTKINYGVFKDCTGFTEELVIPEGITYIGGEAFSGCKNFTGELVIPSSVTNLGESAFENCSGFTGDLVFPEKVYTIWDRVFSGCSGFDGKLVFPDKVYSIQEGAFSGCNGLIGELVIPDGVTHIFESAFKGCSGFTGELVIPDSVRYIKESAFEGCTGFTGDLIIPEGVKEIGNYAFKNCIGLGSVAASDTATDVEPQENTAALQMDSDIAALEEEGNSDLGENYSSTPTGNIRIPDSVTTMGSNPFAGCSKLSASIYFNGDGEVTLPEDVSGFDFTTINAKPQSAAANYAIEKNLLFKPYFSDGPQNGSGTLVNGNWMHLIVVDENNAPMTKVVINGEEKENADGRYAIEFEDGAETMDVEISAEGYYDFSSSIEVEKGGIETIPMVVNDGTLSLYEVDVWTSGSEYAGEIVNTLNNTMTLEYTDAELDGSGGYLYINVNSAEAESEISFDVIQKNGVIKTSKVGDMVVFPIAWDGDVVLTKLIPNEPVFIRIRDEKGNQVTSKIGLRVVSKGALSFRGLDCGLSLSKKAVEVTVPEGIPFVGGSELKFDYSTKLPVVIGGSKSEDGLHVKIAVNMPKKSSEPTKDEWKEWEKNFQKLLKDAEKTGKVKELFNGALPVYGFKTGVIDPPETKVIGYGEGIIDVKGGVQTARVDVGIVVAVEMEASRSYYTFVTWVPIYITFGAEGKLSADIKVGELTISNGELDGGVLDNADLGLEVALIPRAGIGAEDVISVGIAGKGSFNSVFSLAKSDLTKATLQGELYIYGDLLGHELKNTLGRTEPYDLLADESKAKASSNNLNLYNSSSYCLMNRTRVGFPTQNTIASVVQQEAVQTAVYPGADPKLVMAEDTMYLFWLQDIATRSAENRAAIVYATSKDGDTWTAPKQLVAENVNQTMDGTYDVEVTDGKIYICWQDAAEIYESGTTLNEMIQKLYISYAVMDGASGEVILTDTVTDEMGAFFNPQIAVQNGDVKLAFVKNAMTTESGIWNAANTHSLMLYDQANDAVTTLSIGNATEKILSMDMVSSDTEAGMVYVLDMDGDYQTIDDRKICYYTTTAPENGSQQYLMSEAGQISGVTSSNNVYYWNADGKIYYAAAGETQSHTLYTEDVVVPSKFTVASDGSNATLLWEEIHPETEKVVINGIRKTADGWTLPYTVSETTSDVTAKLSSCYRNGMLEYAYLHVAEQEDGSLVYSICTETEADRYDLSLDYADYDSEDFMPGEVLPIQAYITNNGNKDIDSVNVYWDNTLLGSIETSVLVGESALVELNNYIVPETVSGYEEHSLTVSTETEVDSSDNNYTLEIGKTDLSVICNQRIQRGEVWVDMAVNNTSPITTGATLNIRANYKDGKILYTEDLGTIEGNHAVYLTHSFAEYDKSYCDYYIEVVPKVSDATDWNNIELVYTGTGRDIEGGELGYTPTYYTVTFNSNGGTSVESQTVKKGTVVSEPATPTREKYSFSGWYYNGELYDFSTVVESNITLVAQWDEYSQLAMPSANVASGSLLTSGTRIALMSAAPGASIYYTLDGTIPTTESDLYVEPITLLKDTTIKAIAVMDGYLNSEVATFIYVVSEKSDVYTVAFESNGGSVIGSQEVAENECVVKPNDPVRQGYTFLGWYLDGVLYDFATPVTGHLRLEAKWGKTDITDDTSDEVLPEDIPEDGIIPEGIWVAGIRDTVYTGSAIKQEFRVYDNRTLLREKIDYTITYKNNKKVYTYLEEDYSAFEENLKATGKKKTVGTFNPSKAPQIIIKMKGNYAGSHTIYYKNARADITGEAFEASDLAVTYSGKKQTPQPVLTWNGKKLRYGKDYYIPEYDAAKKDKTAYSKTDVYDLTITGKNNFKGEIPIQLTISKGVKQIAFSKVSIKGVQNMLWDEGRQIVQDNYKLSYKNDDFTKESKEYEVHWGTNTDVGTGTVKFTGTGVDADGDGYSYIGSKTVTFKIKGTAMKKVEVSAVKPSYPYTGEAIKVDYLLNYKKDKNAEPMELTENTHYTVEYQKNVEKGTATIIFKGKESGGFTGTKKVSFIIKAKGIQDITSNGITTEQISVSYKDSQNVVDEVYVAPYMKGGAKPEIVVTSGETILKLDKDYTVSYDNNKKVALFTDKKAPVITIKGKGNYTGTKKVYFSIKEKPLSAEMKMTLIAKDKIENTKKNGYKQSFKVYDADGKVLSKADYDSKNVVYTLVEITNEDGTSTKVNEELGDDSTVYAGSVIQITVQGKGNYADGELTGTYRILEKNYDISKAVIQIKNQDYTGKDIFITKQDQFITGKIYIKIGNEKKELILNEDIEIVDGSYVRNRNKGTAKVTFHGMNDFGGTKTVSFKIGSRSIVDFWKGIFTKKL